jgi:exodeoxyribonuclease-3
MRVATFNINGTQARLAYLKHFLREISPDLCGIQELKMTDAQFPKDALREVGYECVTHGQKSWNGVAVLSKAPVEVETVGLAAEADQGARLLSVRAGELRFTTIYVPNGKTVEHEDFGKKIAWLDALNAWIGKLPKGPHVVCGDFNVVPAPIDSWNEELLKGTIFHTDAERSRIRRLESAGYIDLWRAAHPTEPGHTWWDYRAGSFHKKQGLRIDLLFATPDVAARATNVAIDRKWRKKIEEPPPPGSKRGEKLISSDHLPVWADLG